jgi:hypothetical protein
MTFDKVFQNFYYRLQLVVFTVDEPHFALQVRTVEALQVQNLIQALIHALKHVLFLAKVTKLRNVVQKNANFFQSIILFISIVSHPENGQAHFW